MEDFTKHEDDVLDYMFDWSEWLATTGDKISTSDFVSVPPGLVLTLPTNTNYDTTVWVGGGNNQGNYKVVNTITTLGGRTKTEYITVRIRNAR